MDNITPMKTLYLPELESFLESPLFQKSDYLTRENRVFRVTQGEGEASALVLGQEPLPQRVDLVFSEQALHCRCECGSAPCLHCAGLLRKLHQQTGIPAASISELLDRIVHPEKKELPREDYQQGDLFGGLDLFAPSAPARQSYTLKFQFYRKEDGDLHIRPANRHILEDGNSGHITQYVSEKLKDPPGLKQQALIDLLQKDQENLLFYLEKLQELGIIPVSGQMGLPLTVLEMDSLHIRFRLHSYVPGRGILFSAYLQALMKGETLGEERELKDFEPPRQGVLVFDSQKSVLLYMKDCSREQTFLRLLQSKQKGLLEKDLEGMTRLRERLKADKIRLDYSLVDTRIREYSPRLILQLKNRYGKLQIHFVFRYEDSSISFQDLRDYFPAAEEGCGVLYKRNRDEEARWMHLAAELLEDEIVYQRGYYASMVEASSSEDLRLRIELQDFLAYYGEDLIQQGMELELEKHSLRLKGQISVQLNRQSDWLELETREGDEEIFLDDLFESHGLVNIGGSYLKLQPQDIDLIRRLKRQGLDPQGKLESSAANQPLLETVEEHLQDGDPLKERLQDLRELNLLEEDPSDPPRLEGFQAELRNYQQHGLHWLRFLHSKGLQGCLADDMGLGKTVQTLSLIHHLKEQKQWKLSLLIGPVVTLANWEAEIEKFSPQIRFIRHQGGNRARDIQEFSGMDLIITSYQTIRNDMELFGEMDFFYIILDEAHYIKNASSQTFHAVNALKSHHRLSLTGTPIENNTLELWSQMSFLNPGLLGSLRDFQYRFALPIEREGSEEAAELLRQTVYPFILRRTKEEVATDLPEREEITLTLEMEGEQQQVYQKMKDYYRGQVKGLLGNKGRQKSNIEIFSYLLKLRQLAIFPPMAGEDYQDVPSCKMDTLMDLLEEICSEDHKVLVFSTFLGTLEHIRGMCETRHWAYSLLTGKTENREEQIGRFQQDPDTKIFLLSLKAGGVGINLTAADYVILFDPWWNPAVEKQAIDRAYRIGQTRKVFTYRLITRGSIEEKIRKMQENKQYLADQIITEDEGFSKNLEDEDILRLFE